ncbi:unnamed protein product [Toxocara canis]|uniref:Metallo-beta-lactamase domain-containing protein n=1 Tax=Toxocara canis TaxID=6265 RepID=A0A3P7GPP7_TOXCA|nr:unnamed protein product [Toxocara canis]
MVRLMSTFCGRINGCDWISLDHFGGENLSSIVFFLSHCHQDHMKGLADDAFYAHLCEHNCFLYCHPVTKVLLENSPKYTRLLKYIKTKDIDQKFRVTDSLDEVASIQQPADQSTRGVNVTFIDAQHCPGSVMVLLEFDDGKRVLYTGDFRFVKDDWFSCKALRDPKTKSGFKRIDELYFDSTFCRQGSRVFPSRKRSGALFVRMVKEWLDARTHNKVLIWSSSYGQEFLFRKIYEELQMKVHVTMQKFQIPEIASFVTCVASSTRVHACATVPDVEELEFEEIDQVIVPSCPNSSNNRQKE